jgi:hypothetical protein
MAARAAMEQIGGMAPSLVVVFMSAIRYKQEEVLRGIRLEIGGDVPLVGGSSSGQFVNGTYLPKSSAVTVLVWHSNTYRMATAYAQSQGNLVALGRSLGESLRTNIGETDRNSAVLLFADGLMGNQQDLVDGLYHVLGPEVPIVGAATADDRTLQGTFVYCQDRILSHGAVGVWITGPVPPRIVTAHGWKPLGKPYIVTQSDGSVIRQIDGRSAMDVIREALGNEGDRLNTERLSTVALTHPIGILHQDGIVVRHILDSPDNQSVLMFSPVRVYSAVRILSGTYDSLMHAVDTLMTALTEPLPEGTKPSAALIFSCVAREGVYGDRTCEEAQRIHRLAPELVTMGFYGYGEFARLRGLLGYHNATITALGL